MSNIDTNHFNELEVTLDDRDYVQSVKPTLTHKECATCHRKQPISYYIADARAKDGYEKNCAVCKQEMYEQRRSLGAGKRTRVAYVSAVATQKAVVYAPAPVAAPVEGPVPALEGRSRTQYPSDIKDVLEMVEWAYSTLTQAQRGTLVRLLNALEE